MPPTTNMPTTKEITLYTLAELREAHPDAYATAWKRHRDQSRRNGSDWAKENSQSLHAVLDVAGANIGHRGGLSMDDNCAAFSGRRAWAWLENRILAPHRIPWRPMHASAKRRLNTRYGRVRPCPFTGYRADGALLDDIRDSIRAGMTVGDALRALPDVVERLNENDVEYAESEEQFLASNEEVLFNDKGEQE